ncbi:type VII secretion protein EccB [Microbacterium sp. NC79]|uniref:type VII secretion protein EccB n=1 Tax=Microbacterium sp. NC79 TaxID=2851009 RepID=UPI001C2C7280|nr:type VII secretion protein EccB [Microbacterium sp. NC79]
MASKSDLLDAQAFSRRRLLTAFVSGAPGGRELEPAKPLRGVVAGVSLSILVLLVGLFIGMMQKGLPSDWGNGKLIIDQSTGSRYITIDDELWPILNIASARLLLEPDASADPIVVSGGLLTGVPVRDTIGIPGAPDTVPSPGKLVNTGWTACVAADGAIDTRILSQPIAKQTGVDEAAVVTLDGRYFVVSGRLRMEVPASNADAILRDLGLGSAPQHVVTSTWLNLFEEGDALAPLTTPGAGDKLRDSDLRVGDVIYTTTTDASMRFLVLKDGSLAELSPLAFALYQQGSSYSAERTFEVDSQAISSMPNSNNPVTSADWPRATFAMLPATQAPCALTVDVDGAASSVLASVSASAEDLTGQTIVEPSMGALVNVAGFGQEEGAVTLLIDSTATSYAVPGADADILAKLGYVTEDVGVALAPWIQLFHGGPDLTQTAAGARSDGSVQ